jgi:hypothetical protein
LEFLQTNDASKSELVQNGFLLLANNLCAATNVGSDDVHSLRVLLQQARGLCSLALEYLAEGDAQLAVDILCEEYPKNLFRIGLGLITELRQQVLSMGLIPTQSVDKIFELSALKKFGPLLTWMDNHLRDKVGFEACEMLKGLFNRYPQRPLLNSESGKIIFVPFCRMQDLDECKAEIVKILKAALPS